MTPTGPSTRLDLGTTVASAPVARTALRQLLDDAGVGTEVRETAVLLATELVSNAVEHGGGSSYLDAVVGPEAVRLEVTDPNPTMPQPPEVLDDLDERGRGLFLIAALASRWGAEKHPPGKTVWCEIALA